jgi:hypothetical protein
VLYLATKIQGAVHEFYQEAVFPTHTLPDHISQIQREV